MHQERSYVLALKNAWLPRHLYRGVDGDGLSLRTAEGLLLLGGGSHRTGENPEGGKYAALLDAFINAPGWYFARMHQERSYVLALKNAWLPRHLYRGVDGDGLSLRTAEGLLLLGGGSHRTGENPDGGKYAALLDAARLLFPGAQEVARWSAQDCVTVDRLPCIGPYALAQPRWYVATGFAKWGMTSSMVAARILSGMIAGDTPDFADVFSPQRPVLSADNMKPLLNETGHALRNLARVTPAPRCRHPGCTLTWNPDEDTWDCPCHGSRFSPDGSLLDGPAQTDLEK